jgi:HlyD family secretion protein
MIEALTGFFFGRVKNSDGRLAPDPRQVDSAAVEFQPDAVIIEERPLPGAAQGVVYIVSALIVTALLWASLSQIDRVVTARGKLITVDPLIVVQPLETGVIRSINVRVGDFAPAGTILATLDPTFTQSQAITTQERLSSMLAEQSRLEAEIYGSAFPPLAGEGPLDPKYLKLQEAIYAHRRAEYQASVGASEADIARFEASLQTNQKAQEGFAQRLKVIGDIETMRQDLYNLKVGSRLNLLQSQLDRLSLTDQLGEKKNQEKELLQQLASAREQKERYINNWIREGGERLTKTQQDIATAADQLASAMRKNALVVLRSPVDAVVLELGQRSIGSVAKEAEPLVTLVPQGNKIEAEVDVDSADVARLRVGDSVRVKLDALPFQRHGTLSGTLRVVTENSFEPDKKSSAPGTTKPDGDAAFFRARIALEPLNLQNVPADFRLIPGMTTTAEIKVGKRTIVSYVMDPVIRLFDEGLREP